MNRKQLAVAGGLATIVAAVTAANQKKKWQEVHTAAVITGALITIVGALT